MQEKPGVASIACATGHYGKKNSVAYVRINSGNIELCLKTDTDVVTLTFDLLTPKQINFQNSLWNVWNVSMSSLVI